MRIVGLHVLSFENLICTSLEQYRPWPGIWNFRDRARSSPNLRWESNVVKGVVILTAMNGSISGEKTQYESRVYRWKQYKIKVLRTIRAHLMEGEKKKKTQNDSGDFPMLDASTAWICREIWVNWSTFIIQCTDAASGADVVPGVCLYKWLVEHSASYKLDDISLRCLFVGLLADNQHVQDHQDWGNVCWPKAWLVFQIAKIEDNELTPLSLPS